MRHPDLFGPELSAAIRRYVTPETGGTPRYMWLLHGNFTTKDKAQRTPFLRQLAGAARQISDGELATLLGGEWRSRLTAAWLIGLDRREQFRDQIGERLLASQDVYAGQGYCVSLARLATAADASPLAAYLDAYLPQLDKRYDQDWALGALLHLDVILGTDYAARFLTNGGLWQRWSKTEQAPAELRARIDQLCSVADECMRTD
jgi:Family of unknown function (DUF6000)